jgi:hypothetical protein
LFWCDALLFGCWKLLFPHTSYHYFREWFFDDFLKALIFCSLQSLDSWIDHFLLILSYHYFHVDNWIFSFSLLNQLVGCYCYSCALVVTDFKLISKVVGGIGPTGPPPLRVSGVLHHSLALLSGGWSNRVPSDFLHWLVGAFSMFCCIFRAFSIGISLFWASLEDGVMKCLDLEKILSSRS